MNSKWLKGLKHLFSYGFVLYALVAVVIILIGNPRVAAIRRLNTISSWGDYPMDFALGKSEYDARKFYLSNLYYNIASNAFSSDTVLSTVGYGCAKLNKMDCAVKFYKKAEALAPNRIWYDYALGSIFFSQKDFLQAREYFKKVVEIDFRSALEAAMLSSLGKMPAASRKMLFSEAAVFVKRLMQQSQLLLKAIELNQTERVEAPQPVLHPWHYVIPPGKEQMF